MKQTWMTMSCGVAALFLVGCGGGSSGGTTPDGAAAPDTGAADTSQPPSDTNTTPPDTSPPPVDTTTTPPPDTSNPPPPPPAAMQVDPNCIDGQYTEALPPYTADIGGLISGYSSNNYMAFIDAVLAKRYAVGQYLVNTAITTSNQGNCIDYFLGQKNTGKAIIDQMSTFVHECGHFADIAAGGFTGGFGGGMEAAYLFRPDLTLKCTDGGGTVNGGPTFARSLLMNDEYATLWPPCAGFGGSGCDFYASTYLDGDPNNGNFEGGDQGFGSVLEEATQYVNSLATGYAFQDFVGWNVSERDGILTFLMYIQRYLRMARLQHPQVYSIITNECWREVILTIWGRGWLYLEATKDIQKLGIADAKIKELVLRPDLMDEIQRVRDLEGCP